MSTAALVDIRLVGRASCELCDGTGEQLTEDWQEYEARADEHRTPPDPEQWFFNEKGYESVPAMREPCETCGGSGTREIEVGVDALLEIVERWVRRPMLTDEELDPVVETLKASLTAAASKSQGLADPVDVGSWLRAVQEAAEALRAVAELRPRLAGS